MSKKSKPKINKEIIFNLIALSFSLVLMLALLEGFFTFYYFKKDGRLIPVADKIKSETNSYTDEFVARHVNYGDSMFPHPYLSFVHNPTYSTKSQPINNVGLLGQDFPWEKEKGTFYLLFTGGSVASQMAGFNQDLNILEKELNKNFTNEKIKKFVVLNGGVGAWHQPQSLILFQMVAQSVDGVIVLDGFNEHYLIDSSYSFEFPADNYYLATANQFGSKWQLWPLWLDGKLKALQRKVGLFRRSRLSYFVIDTIRNKSRAIYKKPASASVRPSMRDVTNRFFLLPNDWPRDKKIQYSIESYKKYARLIKASADAMKVKSLYLIQPCPAIDKDLTPEEKKLVGDLSYENIYREMANSLLTLKEEGVPIYNLGDIYKNEKSDIYTDAVHVNEKGNELMRSAILRHMENEWGIKRRGSA